MGRTSLRIILSDVGERRLGQKRRRLAPDLTQIPDLTPDPGPRPDPRSGPRPQIWPVLGIPRQTAVLGVHVRENRQIAKTDEKHDIWLKNRSKTAPKTQILARFSIWSRDPETRFWRPKIVFFHHKPLNDKNPKSENT